MNTVIHANRIDLCESVKSSLCLFKTQEIENVILLIMVKVSIKPEMGHSFLLSKIGLNEDSILINRFDFKLFGANLLEYQFDVFLHFAL